jgi:hypothetical protein
MHDVIFADHPAAVAALKVRKGDVTFRSVSRSLFWLEVESLQPTNSAIPVSSCAARLIMASIG